MTIVNSHLGIVQTIRRWCSRPAGQARARAIGLVKQGRDELRTARARAIHAKLKSQRAETAKEVDLTWSARQEAERALGRTRERVTDRLEVFSSEEEGDGDE